MLQAEIKAKIYVSASWEDRHTAKKVMLFLEENGFEITCDWTKHATTPQEEIYKVDRESVRTCDYFVLLNGYKCTTGKFWECGLADAWEKPIILAGNTIKSPFGKAVLWRVKGRIFDGDMPQKILDALEEIILIESSGIKLVSQEPECSIPVGDPIPREEFKNKSPREINAMMQKLSKDYIDGLGRGNTEYHHVSTCMTCGKSRFVSAGTGNCMNCDEE